MPPTPIGVISVASRVSIFARSDDCNQVQSHMSEFD
jgi:hypothetical protein